MRYVIMVNLTKQPKNQLQEKVYQQLRQYNRTVYDEIELPALKSAINEMIDTLNYGFQIGQHKCRPVKIDYWFPNSMSENYARKDQYMSFDGENFMQFKIIALAN